MTGIILGILFIFGGIVWFVLAAGAAGMASRAVTFWEGVGAPLLGVIPVAIGIVLIIFG